MSTQVAFFREWRDLMRSWGFTVLEAAGWETRDAEPRSTYLPGMLYLEHHDASTELSGNWGSLAYILANRLANIVTARDGQIMLCAAGVCWHAGVGGPRFDVPRNGANTRSLGNEVANDGLGERYDPRCTRSILAGELAWAIVSGRRGELERVLGHKEWATPPGRKTDPLVDMNQRRRDVAAFAPSQHEDEEDPLAISERAQDLLEESVEVYIPGKSGRSAGPGWLRLDGAYNNSKVILQRLAGLEAAVGKLAEAVASGRDDLTADELRQAVSQGIQEAGAALRAIQDSDEPTSAA